MFAQRFYIGTTRFNNVSWNENKRWRENNNTNGCVYNSPVRIASHVKPDAYVFVLEMNNDKPNKIMGIGLIRNHSYREKKYARMYSTCRYNRYTYTGKFRIDVSDMSYAERQVVDKLEDIVFRGKSHLKRGQGIIMIPLNRLEKDKELYIAFFNRIISRVSS